MGLTRRWALAVLVLVGCPAESQPRPQQDPSAKDYVAPPMPKAKVTLKDAYGGLHRVEVEVAATPATRERGMMWRTQLAEGKGMLFIFPAEDDLSFWMKNTLIPLDMIFIGRDKTITGIVNAAGPKTLTSRGVGKRSLYVLEVAGGWSEKVGLKPGAPVEMEGTSMIEVVP